MVQIQPSSPYYQNTEEIKLPTIPVEELCKNYQSVHDVTDWDEMVAMFLADPVEAETIDFLLEELKVNKQFREPILLGKDEDEETGLEASYVLDGTHRVVAYILANHSEAYVEYDEDEEFDEDIAFADDDLEPVLETEIHNYNSTQKDGEDVMDIWDTLRSLRLNNEHWLTTSVSSGTYDIETNKISTTVMWDTVIPVEAETINQAISEKLTRHGYDLTGVTIETSLYLDDFSDEDDYEDDDED